MVDAKRFLRQIRVHAIPMFMRAHSGQSWFLVTSRRKYWICSGAQNANKGSWVFEDYSGAPVIKENGRYAEETQSREPGCETRGAGSRPSAALLRILSTTHGRRLQECVKGNWFCSHCMDYCEVDVVCAESSILPGRSDFLLLSTGGDSCSIVTSTEECSPSTTTIPFSET
jgi:hypothetical protein